MFLNCGSSSRKCKELLDFNMKTDLSLYFPSGQFSKTDLLHIREMCNKCRAMHLLWERSRQVFAACLFQNPLVIFVVRRCAPLFFSLVLEKIAAARGKIHPTSGGWCFAVLRVSRQCFEYHCGRKNNDLFCLIFMYKRSLFFRPYTPRAA